MNIVSSGNLLFSHHSKKKCFRFFQLILFGDFCPFEWDFEKRMIDSGFWLVIGLQLLYLPPPLPKRNVHVSIHPFPPQTYKIGAELILMIISTTSSQTNPAYSVELWKCRTKKLLISTVKRCDSKQHSICCTEIASIAHIKHISMEGALQSCSFQHVISCQEGQ